MEKVLVIDDSQVTRTLIADILGASYQLDLREDGASGIAAADELLPGLILLDIHLPDIDGYRVCRLLKEKEKTRDIPIVFITAMDSEQERVRGFEAGAEDYVVKPFFPGELRARVKAHLATRRAKIQAVELERLKIFREMAVALSHEINNPLTTLYGYLHLAGKEAERGGAPSKESLSAMRGELDRIKEITEKLAGASRVAETDYHGNTAMIDIDNI